MKFKTVANFIVMTSIVALAIPSQLSAQEQPAKQQLAREHHRYKLIDLGTFGGPNSGNNSPSVIMNNEGAVTGFADTPTPDPYAPNNCIGDCFVQHAFEWRNGVLTDLGPLPGGDSSYTNAINSHGQIVGQSQNGLIDPVTGTPEFVAAVWQDGRVIDLGTFGGGFSVATANNNRQQVVGCAFNDVPDSFAPTGVLYGIGFDPEQLRAFRWQGQELQDLGTLGGPDACAMWINDRGQIAGASFTNSIVNPATGLPTLDPFLWEHGRMHDLGTLGGTLGFSTIVNNRGQVAGQSNLAGDVDAHAFLWERGTMTDLGTLGGTFSTPLWLNDAGEVVGLATTPGDPTFHASQWTNGAITDLGTLDGDCSSVALALNSEGQIVGQSVSCDFSTVRAVVWDKKGPHDLNNLVNPGSGLQLTEPKMINDVGQIVALGLLPNGDLHSVVLIPCDRNHSGDQECTKDDDEGSTTAIQNRPAPVNHNPANAMGIAMTPKEIAARLRARYGGSRGFGARPPR
jgi:probable HAF family extracellular repeat protein